jgi:hypothetical protein
MADVLRTGVSVREQKFTLSGRMVCAALRSLTSRPSEMALETSSAP